MASLVNMILATSVNGFISTNYLQYKWSDNLQIMTHEYVGQDFRFYLHVCTNMNGMAHISYEGSLLSNLDLKLIANTEVLIGF
jgi:hypothetical protein